MHHSFVILQIAVGIFFYIVPNNISAQPTEHYRIVFWNVENLFDTQNDSLTNDDAYTPLGIRHWTNYRYSQKLNNLYKTIIALGCTDEGEDFSTSPSLKIEQPPLLIGLAEVENDKVLRDLCYGTPLNRLHYQFIHYNSPERRGIDNALLYDKERFTPLQSRPLCMSDSSQNYYTRDILYVMGTTSSNDTLIVFINHFPSKRGGPIAESKRINIAHQLRNAMDSAIFLHPSAAVIALGDFNSTPNEIALTQGMELPSSTFTNLMALLPQGEGSYKYQGVWSYIDQIIVSSNILSDSLSFKTPTINKPLSERSLYIPTLSCPLQIKNHKAVIFKAPFLLVDDNHYLGLKPKRTYNGWNYQNGISDHLPVYIDLIR